MNAVPFDTLKLARRLETAGFAPPMAAGTAEAMADAMTEAGLATRSDLDALRQELKADHALLRADFNGLRVEFQGLRGEFKADRDLLRSELKADIELLRRDMVIKLGGMMFVAVGVILTAMRIMPHP